MILVDSSIWIDHLRANDAKLVHQLESGQVICHPMIVGELACGQLRNRKETLKLLQRLPRAVAATDDETMHFVEQNKLMGRGIGFIDAHLLAATALSDSATIWTRDKRLHIVACEIGLAHQSSYAP